MTRCGVWSYWGFPFSGDLPTARIDRCRVAGTSGPRNAFQGCAFEKEGRGCSVDVVNAAFVIFAALVRLGVNLPAGSYLHKFDLTDLPFVV